jgi:hypothetical protein
MVLRPPIMISEWYSSRARLLSPTAGMYLMTICRQPASVLICRHNRQ